MERELVVQTRQLTKIFGSHRAVNELDLNVFRGDVFGLLGPNGSGKTTTIRMLTGLMKPTIGEVMLFGHHFTNSLSRRRVLRRIGAIIEQPTFYPYLSGYDNLLGIATFAGLPWNPSTHKRIEEVLSQVDLASRGKDIYRTYSLGMKQRLGIAAALLNYPELIILDEPTNGLDPAGVVEIRALLAQLAQQGITILISSHLLYEVQQICSQIAIIQNGQLLVQGNVRDLLVARSGVALSFSRPGMLQQAESVLQEARKKKAPWIQDIERIKPEPGTWMPPDGALLRINTSAEKINDVSPLLQELGIYPTEIRMQTPSLEQFFISLTNNNGHV